MLKNNSHKLGDLKAHTRGKHRGISECSAFTQAHSCPLQFAKGPKNTLWLTCALPATSSWNIPLPYKELSVPPGMQHTTVLFRNRFASLSRDKYVLALLLSPFLLIQRSHLRKLCSLLLIMDYCVLCLSQFEMNAYINDATIVNAFTSVIIQVLKTWLPRKVCVPITCNFFVLMRLWEKFLPKVLEFSTHSVDSTLLRKST